MIIFDLKKMNVEKNMGIASMAYILTNTGYIMKIICIGRNYIEQAKELNNNVPAEPVFFIKPESALLLNNEHFSMPVFSKEIHQEVEVVVKINQTGKKIDEKHAVTQGGMGGGDAFFRREIDADVRLYKDPFVCKEGGYPFPSQGVYYIPNSPRNI